MRTRWRRHGGRWRWYSAGRSRARGKRHESPLTSCAALVSPMTDWTHLLSNIDPHRAAYSAFMLLSLVVFVVARRLMPRPGGLAQVPWWKRTLITLGGFVGGALGGKVPFALASAAGPL